MVTCDLVQDAAETRSGSVAWTIVPKCFEAEARGHRLLGDAHPDDVALAHVQEPSASFRKWCSCRSRIGSKSVCILRPDTSTRTPKGMVLPGSTSSMSGPTTVTSAVLHLLRVQHDGELEAPRPWARPSPRTCRPCGCARPRTPARRQRARAISVTTIFRPRTSMALATMFAQGTFDTTCSYVQMPVGRISGMSVSAMVGKP